MPTALIFGLIGGLRVLAFFANRLSRLTRIPDVFMFMALGVVIGAALRLAEPASLTGATNLLGTLAIILVLFEGEAVVVEPTSSSEPTVANPAAEVERASRRWILHAGPLLLLTLAALLLWYSRRPEERGPGSMQQWWHDRAAGGK